MYQLHNSLMKTPSSRKPDAWAQNCLPESTPRCSVSGTRPQQAAGAATSTMLKLMVDGNVPAAVRLRAAEAVYDRGVIKGI
jgi:hypothetical protein